MQNLSTHKLVGPTESRSGFAGPIDGYLILENADGLVLHSEYVRILGWVDPKATRVEDRTFWINEGFLSDVVSLDATFFWQWCYGESGSGFLENGRVC